MRGEPNDAHIDLVSLGAIWTKILNDGDTWTDRDGKTRVIAALDADHRSNIRRYLRRNMKRLELVCSLYEISTLPKDEEVWTDEIVDALAIQTPLEWLYAQPLFKALVAADTVEVVPPAIVDDTAADEERP